MFPEGSRGLHVDLFMAKNEIGRKRTELTFTLMMLLKSYQDREDEMIMWVSKDYCSKKAISLFIEERRRMRGKEEMNETSKKREERWKG